MNASHYLDGLLQAYEDEVSGISYFNTLALYFEPYEEKKKLTTLAAIEAQTAKALKPLVSHHPRLQSSSALKKQGVADAHAENPQNWRELMTMFAEEFSPFIDVFSDLLTAAPEQDKVIIKQLLAHEIAIVEFAKQELLGNSKQALHILQAHLTNIYN